MLGINLCAKGEQTLTLHFADLMGGSKRFISKTMNCSYPLLVSYIHDVKELSVGSVAHRVLTFSGERAVENKVRKVNLVVEIKRPMFSDEFGLQIAI